jgi:hypothetical protein
MLWVNHCLRLHHGRDARGGLDPNSHLKDYWSHQMTGVSATINSSEVTGKI